MAKELKVNVYVDGVLYEAGSTPPRDVADQISNPKAWSESEERPEPAKKAPAKKPASSKSE